MGGARVLTQAKFFPDIDADEARAGHGVTPEIRMETQRFHVIAWAQTRIMVGYSRSRDRVGGRDEVSCLRWMLLDCSDGGWAEQLRRDGSLLRCSRRVRLTGVSLL